MACGWVMVSIHPRGPILIVSVTVCPSAFGGRSLFPPVATAISNLAAPA
jgi:hypothetical protein